MNLRAFPTDRQLDKMDCGPACLKMISKHYGKFYSLQYLRDKCGVTKEGVSFDDISHAGEAIGLRTLALKCTLDELLDKIPLPAIVHWNNSHFVVVYNTKRQSVISESELDKTQISYLASKDGLQSAINNLINAQQTAQETESKLQELGVQKPEKEKELRIALISAYNDFDDNIKSWEQKYVFKAAFAGKVQLLEFYTENQFVQAGEQVFTIVPKQEKAFGQVVLPAQGRGKVKVGQEVIVKLDDYPYMEYGSITGRVKTISLTTSTTKTANADVETYMVLVNFPNQLKTNYGTKLDFRADAKGSAEIITNDRRLIQRLFDNLKYVMKK